MKPEIRRVASYEESENFDIVIVTVTLPIEESISRLVECLHRQFVEPVENKEYKIAGGI